MHRRTFLKNLSAGFVLTLCSQLILAERLFAQAIKEIKVWSAAKGTYVMTKTIQKGG